jgi:hypothetical protein
VVRHALAIVADFQTNEKKPWCYDGADRLAKEDIPSKKYCQHLNQKKLPGRIVLGLRL